MWQAGDEVALVITGYQLSPNKRRLVRGVVLKVANTKAKVQYVLENGKRLEHYMGLKSIKGKWGEVGWCTYCEEPVKLQQDGTMEGHIDIYPTRLCEGGNRRPGDTGDRKKGQAKEERSPEKVLAGAKGAASRKKNALALEIALKESLKLQSHYAELLNQWDGGQRMTFRTPEEWIARLKKVGVIHDEPDA